MFAGLIWKSTTFDILKDTYLCSLLQDTALVHALDFRQRNGDIYYYAILIPTHNSDSLNNRRNRIETNPKRA